MYHITKSMMDINRPVSYTDVMPPLRIFTYGTDVVNGTKATEILRQHFFNNLKYFIC